MEKALATEVRLAASPAERERIDSMADLYAIFICTENLEKAYVRDWIDGEQYTAACLKLIAQYKTAVSFLSDAVPDVLAFVREYNINCPAAVKRLVDIGVPATVEHGGKSPTSTNTAKAVAETVQHLITLLDLLQMDRKAVDDVHPRLADLMVSMNGVPMLPKDFAPRVKLTGWLVQLNKMRASEELDEAQVRQLRFDLEQAHVEFIRAISDKA